MDSLYHNLSTCLVSIPSWLYDEYNVLLDKKDTSYCFNNIIEKWSYTSDEILIDKYPIPLQEVINKISTFLSQKKIDYTRKNINYICKLRMDYFNMSEVQEYLKELNFDHHILKFKKISDKSVIELDKILDKIETNTP